MNDLILNPSYMTLIDGDYTKSSEFNDIIIEFDGYITLKNQYMTFTQNQLNIEIIFDISICGDINRNDGDYSDYLYVSNINSYINITTVLIDTYELDLSKELLIIFENIVKSNL